MSLVLSSLALLVLVNGCKSSMTQNEAKKIASDKLAWYCQQEHLGTADFGEPRTSKEKSDYVFDYTSQSKPVHLVRIYVTSSGGTELHRLIE